MRKKKVLVTGGAGFIGSHIVDKLIEEGHDVVIVDNLSSGNEMNINKNAKFYRLDIEDPKLESIYQEEQLDYITHHAAQKDVRLSVDDPIFDAKVNILGTINILQNCVKYKVKKVIFASTGGAIYGEQDFFPATEEHPQRPISPYGITKLVAEHYLFYYKTIHGLDYASLRYSNVYGPRQDPYGEAGVVAIFVQNMLNGQEPVINGDGEQTRDFVYIEDVVRANIAALSDDIQETVFNIGTGIEISINQIFDHLKQLINPALQKKYGPSKQGEQMRSVIDYSKAEKVLGWKPHVPLPEGLKKTCEYFHSRN